MLGHWYGGRGFLRRAISRGRYGATEEKLVTNDGPIGIGLGRNQVLNLVRLSRGGLSLMWPQRNSRRDPTGKVKTYTYLPRGTGEEFQQASLRVTA